MESKKVVFFNRLSFGTLLATLFISLFFFIPYVPVTLDASKGFLVSIGMTLALFFWLIARLGEGKFSFPNDRILLFALCIPLVFLVSSFFSSSKYVSFFGSGFEIGTFGSMLVLFVLFFLSSIYFQTEKRFWFFYKMLFLGAGILAVFEVLHLFIGVGSIAPGLLKGISAGNLVGSWNDFSILFGLIVILSLFTIEFLKSKRAYLILQYFLLVVGLFFLVIINMAIVWILVTVFSIIIFVYSISVQQTGPDSIHDGGGKKKFPFTALVVVFICLIFLVGNSSIGALLSRYVSLPNTSVRPLASTTAQIAVKAIKHNPFFGTGPNTFNIDWALWQPKGVTQSAYWNVDFNNGYSSLLTFAVTTGILGVFAWLLFLFAYIVRGVQSLRKMLENSSSNYFTMMSLMISIYSWVMIIFYNPNILMFMLAFASTGMLVGVLVHTKTVPIREFSFLKDPRSSFFAILGLMVLMIVTLSTTYVYAEKFASIIYFSKASNTVNTPESLARSEKMLTNALLLDKNDVYYRTLSQVYIAEISSLLNNKNISSDTLKSSVQQLVSVAEESAKQAVEQNPKQYVNYVNLGNVYSAFVPLSIAGSYEGATSAYMRATQLAPNNPSILLSLASLEMSNKSNDKARTFIDQALLLKTDYTDALFLLAQIETNEGDLPGAIKQAEKAAQVAPNDSSVFFRLGLLRYNNTNYTSAVSAFEQAVILDPSYLNAHFMLGEAYQKVGRTSEALAQFKLLAQALPDNQTIKDAIKSVSNGTPVAPTLPVPTTTAPTTNTPIKAPAGGAKR